MSTTLTARPVSSVDIETRIAAVDWASASTHLDGYGWAMLRKLLTADECQTVARLYEDDRRFRSHVVMARHGFGRGEYKYFTYPLPDLVADLRRTIYHRPVQGTRGTYRVNLRHGVSRLRSGHRHTVGVIFHDAK